jgi:hypothetical protein
MAEGWQPIVQRAWQRCKPWRCTSLGKIMANDEHLQKWGLNLESTSINESAIVLPCEVKVSRAVTNSNGVTHVFSVIANHDSI